MRPFHVATTLGLSALFATLPLTALPAAAQTMDTVGPHSSYCGAWQADVWVGNGRCTEETTTVTTTTTSSTTPVPAGQLRSRVNGTITFVKGHLVTIQQSEQTLVIDDQQALDSRSTGRVAVGRSILAHGYWKGGTFYATMLEAQPAG